jgi:hypothetical protein
MTHARAPPKPPKRNAPRNERGAQGIPNLTRTYMTWLGRQFKRRTN